jgi:hypothetical protein
MDRVYPARLLACARGPGGSSPLLFCLTLGLVACQKDVVTPPVQRKVIPLSFQSTQALLQGGHDLPEGDLAEVRRLVDRVAAHQAVAPWPPSPEKTTPEFEAWSTLARRVGPQRVSLFLRHESPVLRVYAARHLVRTEPAQAKRIAPLFFDQTQVRLRLGRAPGRERQRDVGTLLLELACSQSVQPPVLELLAEAVRNQDLGPFRTEALHCVLCVDKPLARTLAVELLSANQDAYLPAGLRVLNLANDKASLPKIEPYAGHRDPLVRQAAADAIGALGGSQPILRGLLRQGFRPTVKNKNHRRWVQ